MDFTICPSHCPRPTIPLHFPSTVISVKQATQPRFSHSSLSLLSSIGPTRCPLGHVFRPIHALDKSSSSMPSENEKIRDNNIGKATLGASLVLACALGIIGCCSKMNYKAIAGPKEMYQKAPHVSELTQPFGGNLALGSFLDVSVKLSSRKMEPPHWPKFEVPPGPSMEDIYAIKMEAVKFMKSGMPEEAVDLLRDLYYQCQHEPEPAYNLEMALVEILIHQGRYEEASKCNCLKEDYRIPSDGRVPLYKAIIYTMLNKNEEASEYWEQFSKIVAGTIF